MIPVNQNPPSRHVLFTMKDLSTRLDIIRTHDARCCGCARIVESFVLLQRLLSIDFCHGAYFIGIPPYFCFILLRVPPPGSQQIGFLAFIMTTIAQVSILKGKPGKDLKSPPVDP